MSDTKHKAGLINEAPEHQVPYAPPLEQVRGGTLMRQQGTRNVSSAADKLLGSSRRILLHHGLNGSQDWFVSGTGEAADEFNQSNPTATAERLAHRTHVNVTPGSHLRARLIAAPSGMVQVEDMGQHENDGGAGAIRIEVRWRNRGTVYGPSGHEGLRGANSFLTSSVDLEVPASDHTNNAVYGISASVDQFPWQTLHRSMTPRIAAPSLDVSAWTEGVEADVIVWQVGSPRIVDLTVFEEPHQLSFHHLSGSDTSAHVYRAGGSTAPQSHPTLGPQESMEDGATYEEPRFGTHMLLDVAQNQITKLAPRVCTWTAWSERRTTTHDQQTTIYTGGSADEGPYITCVTAGLTSFTDLLNSGSVLTADTLWSSSRPGYRVDASHCLRHRHNDPDMVLRGRAAQLPVVVRARVHNVAMNPALLRFQTSARSWIDVPVAGEFQGELVTRGMLEAARTSADPRGNLVVGAATSPSGLLRVRSFSVEVDMDSTRW